MGESTVDMALSFALKTNKPLVLIPDDFFLPKLFSTELKRFTRRLFSSLRWRLLFGRKRIMSLIFKQIQETIKDQAATLNMAKKYT